MAERRRRSPEIYFSMASYAPWGVDARFAETLFRHLRERGLAPERLDQRDPPRRRFSGGPADVEFWLARGEKEWGRWVFLRRAERPNSCTVTVHWVDTANEPMRTRGDYHVIYGSFSSVETQVVLQLWRDLCVGLEPFHALLDELDTYHRRAHSVSPEGRVSRAAGGYLQRLPGLFAHNYFGPVYLRQWDASRLYGLPGAVWQTQPGRGAFLDTRGGLDARRPGDSGYSEQERAIVAALGEEYFHLPYRPAGRKRAPALSQFLEDR